MKQLIFATGNAHKMVEIREILGDLPYEILSMKEAGVDADIVEDGKTFEENALIKAKAVYDLLTKQKAGGSGAVAADGDAMSGLEDEILVLADDSGLEVDALGGEPGIYSARYMGEDTSYDVKNQNIIDRLDGVEDEKRSARFVCAIAAVGANGLEKVVRGTVEGRIAYEPAGENGFGYDPIFYLPERGCTTAELSSEDKNAISHRGNALRLMRKELA